MGRFSRTDQNEDETTWQASGSLGARLEVPVDGAWDRLYAGPKRTSMLESAFSTQLMQEGGVVALVGPRGSGKSTIALAACDLRRFRAVYATAQTDRPAMKPQHGLCVIIDPVSAFDREDVAACVRAYRGTTPVILVDRFERSLQGVVDTQTDTVVKLKLPSPSAIAVYIEDLLCDYNAQLTTQDYADLGHAMKGLSFPQVNQIAVDAALSRLQHAVPVDRGSFDEALSAFAAIRQQTSSTGDA